MNDQGLKFKSRLSFVGCNLGANGMEIFKLFDWLDKNPFFFPSRWTYWTGFYKCDAIARFLVRDQVEEIAQINENCYQFLGGVLAFCQPM